MMAESCPDANTVSKLEDSEYIKTLSRPLNILSDSASDRIAKKIALSAVSAATKGLNPDQISSLFAAKSVRVPLLRCFADPVEKCRETSISLVSSMVQKASDLTTILPYLIPVLSSRLDQDVEPAEEIRLMLIKLLLSVVNLSKAVFTPGVDEAVKILQTTVTDAFPDVRKESCSLIISLCTHTPRALSPHCPPLAKALIPSLQHRHAAVRIQTLRALTSLMLVDATALDELQDALRALTMDRSQSVREALFAMAATWLLKLMDRYSIGHKVLPILLAGLVDEVVSVKAACFKALDEIGALYEVEWPDRVKEDLDYSVGLGGVLLEARPRVGVRHLARDNTQKIIGKIVDGLHDWNADVRAKSASILAAFLPLTEKNATGYMGNLLPAIYKVLAADIDAAVIRETLKATEIIGRYVEPDVYLSLVLSHSSMNPDASTTFSIGCLRSLGALISGTPVSAIQASHRVQIAKALSDSDMVGSENVAVLLEVSVVTKALASRMAQGGGVGSEGYTLFVVLMTLESVNGNDKIPGWLQMQKNTEDAFELFAQAHGHASSADLVPLYFDAFLASFESRAKDWTRFSTADLRTLDKFLKKAKNVVGSRIGALIPVFTEGISENKDVEVRESLLKTFHALVSPFPPALDHFGALASFSTDIVNKVALPCAVWRAGRKMPPSRGYAMQIISALLDPRAATNAAFNAAQIGYVPLASVETFLTEGNSYVPVTIACLEEDLTWIRVEACVALEHLLNGAARCNAKFTAHAFKIMYPELLKRLDDASDDVRIQACNAFMAFSAAINVWHAQNALPADGTNGYVHEGVYVETRLDSVHWIEMIKGVAIHVDDSNTNIQDAASEALVALSKLAPVEVAREQLAAAQAKFRNSEKISSVVQRVFSF
ncbi:HEAT repeat-containing protein 2 [Chytriomyces hyalinus]|nr:HEAT repeat-containing protein 2 [Chytriomyces hyalinus]